MPFDCDVCMQIHVHSSWTKNFSRDIKYRLFPTFQILTPLLSFNSRVTLKCIRGTGVLYYLILNKQNNLSAPEPISRVNKSEASAHQILSLRRCRWICGITIIHVNIRFGLYHSFSLSLVYEGRDGKSEFVALALFQKCDASIALRCSASEVQTGE
jgi:hypothetical protein